MKKLKILNMNLNARKRRVEIYLVKKAFHRFLLKTVLNMIKNLTIKFTVIPETISQKQKQ